MSASPIATDQPVLSYWAADESLPLTDLTVGALLRRTAAERPDVLALEGIPDDGSAPRRWTYAELLAEAEAVAAGILARVGLGERVAIWAPSVAEWPIVEYAAALAGVTLVTLNPTLRAGELEHALRTAECTMLLHAEKNRTYDMAEVVAKVAPGLPHLRHVVSLADWAGLKGTGPLPSEGDIAKIPAQIQFTSGTTGAAKAVLLSHESIVNVAQVALDVLEVADGTTVVSPLPMFHTAGCIVSCLGPLCRGGTFVLLERFAPQLLLDVLNRHPGAVLTSVPTILGALNDVARTAETRPRLSAVITGAAPVRAKLITESEELFATTVFNLYGQTELASVVTLTRPEDTATTKTTTVGRAMPHMACKIADPDTGEAVPVGTTGEICARGYQQMIAYYGDAEATVRKVDAEGWLHTGDLGAMDETGAIRLDGRLSDIIIRGGENISPAAVETFLSSVPGIREAVVVGLPDDTWGEIVGAVLKLEAEGRTEPVDLVGLCKENLSPHSIPTQWFVAEEFPLTASGKIQKFRVQDVIAEGGYRRLDSGTLDS